MFTHRSESKQQQQQIPLTYNMTMENFEAAAAKIKVVDASKTSNEDKLVRQQYALAV